MVLWNVAVLHISNCTVADKNCYELVLWNSVVLHITKCTESDINSYGLVLWNVAVLHISNCTVEDKNVMNWYYEMWRFYTSVNVQRQL
jgi:hypothetical protein